MGDERRAKCGASLNRTLTKSCIDPINNLSGRCFDICLRCINHQINILQGS